MADRQKYPVFIEETTVKLMWIEADSAEDAAKQFTEYPGDYDYGRGASDPVDGWITGVAPSEMGRYDWDAVYGYTGAADEPDAHVWKHRSHLMELARIEHAKTGHPSLREYVNHRGERWCPDCHQHVAQPVTAPYSSGEASC